MYWLWANLSTNKFYSTTILTLQPDFSFFISKFTNLKNDSQKEMKKNWVLSIEYYACKRVRNSYMTF